MEPTNFSSLKSIIPQNLLGSKLDLALETTEFDEETPLPLADELSVLSEEPRVQ
jgi:hypothetical protein